MSIQKRYTNFVTSLLVPVICAAGILLASPVVHAQRRLSVPMSRPQPHHVIYGAPPVHRAPVNRARWAYPSRLPFRDHRHNNTDFGCAGVDAGLPVGQLLETFPGAGFDFEHLNAINSELAIKAAIDPVTQIRLGEAERLACRTLATTGNFLVGGGYLLPEEPEQEEQQLEEAPPATAQPQIIVLQQAPAAPPAQQVAAEPEEAQPLPDEGQFVLVLRDRTQVQALAFTQTTDKVVYITTEGARRTMAASDLDSPATIRVNEERGTPLELSH